MTLPKNLRSLATRFVNRHPKGSIVSRSELDRLLLKAMDVGYHDGSTDAWWDVRTNDPCRKKVD